MKKMMKKILIAVLSLAMIVCFVPQTGVQVYAADGDPAMVLGAESVLKATANTDDAQTVYYGINGENPIAWRVISCDGEGNEYMKQTGVMTLFPSDLLATDKQFNSDSQAQTANDYAGSDLQSAVNGLFSSLFSEKEQKAVISRSLDVGDYSVDYPYSTGVSGSETSGYLWPLSTAEAYTMPSSTFRSAEGTWWLRSPGVIDSTAAFVNDSGLIGYEGMPVDNARGIRPAFNLDLSSVLFTSAASVSDGGKVSDGVGPDALTTVSSNLGSEWKLTIKDGDHADFAVSTVTPGENSVTVEYKNAEDGQNEYISAIITDKPITEKDAAIKYYGRIAQAAAANSSVTINTAGKLGENDHLYVFNEQYNGDKKTDYASALTEVKVPELISYTVTFKVKNGSWNDETKADKKVTLSRYDNEDKALVLQPGDIPKVGNKPANGYKAGSWDVTPKTDTQVTKDMTYTYTYAKKDDPKPTPTPTNKVSGTLIAKMTAKGSKNLVISWNKINGAAGYDVFFVKCGKNNTCKLVKTIKGNKTLTWTKKSLKKKTAYKAIVKAYVMKDGKKSYLKKSPVVHAYTSGGTKSHTNAKSVTVAKTKVSLKVGKVYKVTANVTVLQKGKKLMSKEHAPKLRYLSSNTKVAKVSSSGKITAKGKGTCKVYAYAVNGAKKAITVTVV